MPCICLFEGISWGLNGISNTLLGVTTTTTVVAADVAALAALSITPGPVALVGAVGLAGVNCLAYYVAKAQFSIAGKSFTHMKNTVE